MGDRAQVKIVEESGHPVYLYTHWYGHKIKEITANALSRGAGRWNDSEYLARIIFSEMIRDDIDGTTGYGISTVQHGDTEILVTVDGNRKEVFVEHLYENKIVRYSFEEFINAFGG